MELAKFIEQIGMSRLAEILEVSATAVASWRDLESAPRPVTALQMIAVSQGALTWQTIYEPFARKILKGKSMKVPNPTIGGVMEYKF